jgi:hypothetical protein
VALNKGFFSCTSNIGREGVVSLDGWKHDSRKKATQICEQVMGNLLAAVLLVSLINGQSAP